VIFGTPFCAMRGAPSIESCRIVKIFSSASVLLIFAIPTPFLLSLEKLGLYWFIKFATIPGTRLAVDPVDSTEELDDIRCR